VKKEVNKDLDAILFGTKFCRYLTVTDKHLLCRHPQVLRSFGKDPHQDYVQFDRLPQFEEECFNNNCTINREHPLGSK
jgi:hypothetical protein